MAEEEITNPNTNPDASAANEGESLEGGTYEVLRKRLIGLNTDLCTRLDKLNEKRKETFGGLESAIVGNERIKTENNCIPRDICSLGEHLIFGFNVFIGLKTETKLNDVFSIYSFDGSTFHEADHSLIQVGHFERDFRELYKYYKHARFLQFVVNSGHLLIIFQIAEQVGEVRIFRFEIQRDLTLTYIDDRGDLEYKLPPQHELEWTVTTRDDHVAGEHPHVSIKDKVFVECIGGDLTIKLEDNTESGEGIYAEPVENPDQTLDDAVIAYSEVGDLIVIKAHPYRELNARYFIFNHKQENVVRIDSIEQACIQLPEGHGLIFPKGYYLQNGVMRQFEEDVTGMVFLKCVRSPNGEDFLYAFYHVEHGWHILLQYNLITKEIANPIFCHGFSLYNDGKMVLFNSPDDEPRRNHAMQIWQTPFYADTFELPRQEDTFLSKVGNRDLVRGISEGFTISRLISSQRLGITEYQDIISSATSLLDGYHWLDHEETFNIKDVGLEIKNAATAAVNEYEKVIRIRKNTEQQIKENQEAVRKILLDCSPDQMGTIDNFVDGLSEIRTRRGHVISLRDLRYADLEAINELDEQLADATEKLSLGCVDFLLRDDALTPYITRNEEIATHIQRDVKKLVELQKEEEALEDLATRLDLLTDVVNNLKVDDATKTTKIIDGITDVYAAVNRTRALARNLEQELGKAEAQAEFAAQYKFLSQSIMNYIGMCDTPEKTDEYLTKLMLTIEELEGKFADYEDYAEQLSEKREEAYNAFSSRKQVLEEGVKRKVGALQSSAERILKSITGRADTFKETDEINAFFASDLMVSKLRDIIEKLHDMSESVKADDLTGRLKSAKDEILRGLRDKKELFLGGDNVIKFGDYHFTVNAQTLELSTVQRDGDMYFHLSGTDFYELIEDPEFLTTKSLWEQELVSESSDVYRAEYLAYKILMASVEGTNNVPDIQKLVTLVEHKHKEELDTIVREFAASRYKDGYEKGIHDHDAQRILDGLVKLYNRCELLRYDSESRARAILFWSFYEDERLKTLLRDKLESYGFMTSTFESKRINKQYVDEVREAIVSFYEQHGFTLSEAVISQSAEYLYYELQDSHELLFTINGLARDVWKRFDSFLKKKQQAKTFAEGIKRVGDDVKARINLIYDWVATYVETQEEKESAQFIWEVVAITAADELIKHDTQSISTHYEVTELLGQHRKIEAQKLSIYFDQFLILMKHFVGEQVPLYERYMHLRSELTEERRESMRLSEFKPRVMGAFVRNKLINDVYLNLVGANFAKQMGAAGDTKRTDLMGLLLLISPPGYGKTTLMEYISHRLGLTFMKINGPAIGHNVTSLDPTEAPNATSREELQKLNLSLEMGNNVMIYLDDIQHLNPEFLQKFISLCDAQRKIEGVYRNVTKTYDLRGKKVAVVMAGNPYTESGEKFQIPDMLSNRADTYNLGDISTTAGDAFALSFIENAMTSNPALSKISTYGHDDIYRFIQVVNTGSREGIEFDHGYSSEEIEEIVNVLKKLCKVRDIVMRVNTEYIYSAAQQDEYRTEPAFKLQGSYRNMNRIAEKVFPVMTDEEIDQLIVDNYYNEAQTLTSGAESNILKFKELLNTLTEEESERWEHIKAEFKKRQVLGGDEDQVTKVINQMMVFNERLGDIRYTIEEGIEKSNTKELWANLDKRIGSVGSSIASLQTVLEQGVSQQLKHSVTAQGVTKQLQEFNTSLADIRDSFKQGMSDGLVDKSITDNLIQQLTTTNQSIGTIAEELKSALNREAIPTETLDRLVKHIAGFDSNAKHIYKLLENINAEGLHFHLNKT